MRIPCKGRQTCTCALQEGMWRRKGLLHSFLNSGLDGGQFSAPATLFPREDAPLPIEYEDGWTSEPAQASPQPETCHNSLCVQLLDQSLFRPSYRPQIQIHLLQYWDAFYVFRGSRWRSCLRNCAKSRKVAGSIPGGIIGIINLFNPSGLGVDSASKRNEYQECLLGVKAAGAYG